MKANILKEVEKVLKHNHLFCLDWKTSQDDNPSPPLPRPPQTKISLLELATAKKIRSTAKTASSRRLTSPRRNERTIFVGVQPPAMMNSLSAQKRQQFIHVHANWEPKVKAQTHLRGMQSSRRGGMRTVRLGTHRLSVDPSAQRQTHLPQSELHLGQ